LKDDRKERTIRGMAVLTAVRCETCGRDVRGLPDRRNEGGLWFCSDSCYLQHESRLARVGETPRRARRRGPFRPLWKAIKFAVIAVVLATTAFVILVIVIAVRENSAQNAARIPAPITSAQFHRVKYDMTTRQVRRLLGRPTTRGRRCWYYGTRNGSSTWYGVCFRHARVSDWKSTVVGGG
jgi:hypothetical protein